MLDSVEYYMSKFPEEVIDLYYELRGLIYESTAIRPEEKMWAKLPSFYVGESFVRLIPFKDHINVEVNKHEAFDNFPEGYKFTPKGMLQIFVGDELPVDALKEAFKETLV